MKMRVVQTNEEAVDIKSFILKLSDSETQDQPAFTAGSHVDVTGPTGVVRQYSLCGESADGHYQIAVKLEANSRGGSSAMHLLSVGDEVTVSDPRNLFPLSGVAEHHVLISAGIGITPILSMARALSRSNSTFEVEYFAQSEKHAAFLDVLQSDKISAKKLTPHFGLDPKQVETEISGMLSRMSKSSHLYVCGPGPFMELVISEAKNFLPKDNIHFEYFSNAQEPASAADSDSFEINLARSDKTIVVPTGERIIDVLRENGVEIETSCEQGICGTCVVKVLEGIPDHRDMFLLDNEKARNDVMCTCVSGSKSERLVLDI